MFHFCSFNGVASSYINKFLSNILLQESVAVDKSVIEEIVTASAGDVRWAVNNLQFRLQKPSREHLIKY
jgi:DNA polymerase III delta prime subunit